MREVNAILTIAFRDLLKFLRDPGRIVGTFVLPFLIIPIFGGALDSTLKGQAKFNFMAFIFTGVFAQTMFQSSSFGIISLITDRETDFSQTVFVAPISRYSIVFGKILGESLVALTQGAALLVFALIVGVPMSLPQVAALIPVAVITCLLGGGFGIIVLSNLGSRRAVDQLFNFIMLPQFFLGGVFNPIKGLPPLLDMISRIAPLRYAVDLTRNVFYASRGDEYSMVVLASPVFNLVIISAMFGVFLVAGTYLFVRRERQR